MLEALQKSIEKWEGIVAGSKKDEGSSDCPLCDLYLENDCNGCPIKEKTGLKLCRRTPYVQFLLHGDDEYDAIRMLNFLKELYGQINSTTSNRTIRNT